MHRRLRYNVTHFCAVLRCFAYALFCVCAVLRCFCAVLRCKLSWEAIFGISGIQYFSWDFWDFSFKPWDFWDFSMLFKILGFGISILAAGILGFYQCQKPFLGFCIQIVRNFWRYAPFFPVLEICFTCFVVSMLA